MSESQGDLEYRKRYLVELVIEHKPSNSESNKFWVLLKSDGGKYIVLNSDLQGQLCYDQDPEQPFQDADRDFIIQELEHQGNSQRKTLYIFPLQNQEATNVSFGEKAKEVCKKLLDRSSHTAIASMEAVLCFHWSDPGDNEATASQAIERGSYTSGSSGSLGREDKSEGSDTISVGSFGTGTASF